MIKCLLILCLLFLSNVAIKEDPISIANLFEGDIAGKVIQKVVSSYTNVSSVVEFERWWVLKCKIFAQEST